MNTVEHKSIQAIILLHQLMMAQIRINDPGLDKIPGDADIETV